MLVIEATYLERDADLAEQFGHLTAVQAARLAREADVHELVLTHVSRRYRESDVLEEARPIMPNTVVARDLDRFRVLRGDVNRAT
jgi:ribonuclease Z